MGEARRLRRRPRPLTPQAALGMVERLTEAGVPVRPELADMAAMAR